MSGWLSNPAWGWSGPAYKAQKIHSGPGQMSVLNSHWSLEWEAVSDEMSGSFGDAPLRYFSSPGGHWPLSWVGSLTGMLNYHWPSTHPGSWEQLGETLNCDWLCGQPSFSSFSRTSCVLAGWKELLEIPLKWRMKGHQQIPWLGGVEGVARGHESSLHGSHAGVG